MACENVELVRAGRFEWKDVPAEESDEIDALRTAPGLLVLTRSR